MDLGGRSALFPVLQRTVSSRWGGSLNPLSQGCGWDAVTVESYFSLQSISHISEKCVVFWPLCLLLGHWLGRVWFPPLLGERREEHWAVTAGLEVDSRLTAVAGSSYGEQWRWGLSACSSPSALGAELPLPRVLCGPIGIPGIAVGLCCDQANAIGG